MGKMSSSLGKKKNSQTDNKKELQHKADAAAAIANKIDPVIEPVAKVRKKVFTATVDPEIFKQFEVTVANLNIEALGQGIKINKSNITEALFRLLIDEAQKESSPVIKKLFASLE